VAEIRSGLLHLLARPWIYDAFQTLVGANAWRERVVRNSVVPRLSDDALIVDVGCGTGWVLHVLPPTVRYVGIDRNRAYINQARSEFSGRTAQFICDDVSLGPAGLDLQADAVLAIGLLHHLNDNECVQLLTAIARMLKPGGFLLTLDPLFCDEQSSLARAVISRDRGRSVRTVDGYHELLSDAFRRIDTSIERSPLRIPYTGIVCTAYA
jgi:SAM-dependent methyltransferase